MTPSQGDRDPSGCETLLYIISILGPISGISPYFFGSARLDCTFKPPLRLLVVEIYRHWKCFDNVRFHVDNGRSETADRDTGAGGSEWKTDRELNSHALTCPVFFLRLFSQQKKSSLFNTILIDQLVSDRNDEFSGHFQSKTYRT